MYQLISNFIGYTGTTNITQYIVYGAISLGILFVVLVVDWIAHLIGRFFR